MSWLNQTPGRFLFCGVRSMNQNTPLLFLAPKNIALKRRECEKRKHRSRLPSCFVFLHSNTMKRIDEKKWVGVNVAFHFVLTGDAVAAKRVHHNDWCAVMTSAICLHQQRKEMETNILTLLSIILTTQKLSLPLFFHRHAFYITTGVINFTHMMEAFHFHD